MAPTDTNRSLKTQKRGRSSADEMVDAKTNDAKKKKGGPSGSGATEGSAATGVGVLSTLDDKSPKQKSATTSSTDKAPPVQFKGNFDLYAMTLPFLSKVYIKNGCSTPQYEEVYKTILTYQEKDDFSARCCLDPNEQSNKRKSSFYCSQIEDPMEEMPFDISLENMTLEQELTFSASEVSDFAIKEAIPRGEGVSASVTLTEEHCGLSSAVGRFKMTRAWTQRQDDGSNVELYEGHFSFHISYSGLYRRKGHGQGEKYKFAFWAVRARIDDKGEEIGISPGRPIMCK